jgi:hypothetical protein
MYKIIWSKQSKRDELEEILKKEINLVLYHCDKINPLEWGQSVASSEFSPYFFYVDFTDPSNGRLKETQIENMERLKNLILNGEGKDRGGLLWEVVQHDEVLKTLKLTSQKS